MRYFLLCQIEQYWSKENILILFCNATNNEAFLNAGYNPSVVLFSECSSKKESRDLHSHAQGCTLASNPQGLLVKIKISGERTKNIWLKKKKKVLTAKNLFQTENMRSKLTCCGKKKSTKSTNELPCLKILEIYSVFLN